MFLSDKTEMYLREQRIQAALQLLEKHAERPTRPDYQGVHNATAARFVFLGGSLADYERLLEPDGAEHLKAMELALTAKTADNVRTT